MKRILYLLCLFLIGSVVIADPVPVPTPYMPPEQTQKEQNASPSDKEEKALKEPENTKEEIKKEEDKNNNSEYFSEVRGNQTFYYDKYGKFIARDKKVNGQVFFYNKMGQLVGKSVERNNKTFYYNSVNKFLGVCDETGCKDSEFNSIGKIPPLPEIKHFKPVLDENIINPQTKKMNKEDEE